jgi:hypothetical protein
MKNRIACIVLVLTLHTTVSKGQAGFEQYYYFQRNTAPVMVPIVHILNNHNWHAEARYNYEEKSSFSIYAGKSFSDASRLLEYSLTPIIGGVMGRFKGASLGLNASVEYGDFFFASQTQLTCSLNSYNPGFFFGWHDVGYQPLEWLWFGYSLQQTVYGQSQYNRNESGAMVGFDVGKWTFPVYVFNMLDTNPYVVLGVTRVFDLTKK